MTFCRFRLAEIAIYNRKGKTHGRKQRFLLYTGQSGTDRAIVPCRCRSFHCAKVVLRTHFRFESATVPVTLPSALPLVQQLDDHIADLLVRVALGEVFANVLPLESVLLLLIGLLLGEDVVDRLVL